MTVDVFCKLLKIKTFISEKSLDTPVFALIRFRQKVLTEFQSLRWNYSPLKKRPPSCRVAFSFSLPSFRIIAERGRKLTELLCTVFVLTSMKILF